MTTADPNGCTHCGIPQRGHALQFTDRAGWHQWERPTNQQMKDRMHARRAAKEQQ